MWSMETNLKGRTMYAIQNKSLSLSVIEVTADEAQATAYMLAVKYARPITVVDLKTGETWDVMSDE
jgi:hypothetical protein